MSASAADGIQPAAPFCFLPPSPPSAERRMNAECRVQNAEICPRFWNEGKAPSCSSCPNIPVCPLPVLESGQSFRVFSVFCGYSLPPLVLEPGQSGGRWRAMPVLRLSGRFGHRTDGQQFIGGERLNL